MIKKLAEDYAAAKRGLRDYTKARASGKHEELRAGLAKHREVIKRAESHIAKLAPSEQAEFHQHVAASKGGAAPKVVLSTPPPSAPIVAAPLSEHAMGLSPAAAARIAAKDAEIAKRREEGLRPKKGERYGSRADSVSAVERARYVASEAKKAEYGHAPPAAPRELTPLRLDSSSRESAHVKAAIDAAHDGEATGVTAHELGKKLGVSTADAHKVLRSAEALGHVKATEYVRSAGHSKKTYGDRAEMQKTPGMSTTYVHKEHAHFYEKPSAQPQAAADRASQMRADAIRAGKTDFLGRPSDSFRKEWEAKNAPKARRVVSAAKPIAHSARVVNLQVPRTAHAVAPRATPKAGMKAPASAIRIGKKGGRFILSASGQKHYL